jgi:hypothetical protein
MKISEKAGIRRAFRRWTSGAILTAIIPLGFFDSCDDRLANVSSYVDPCGTILGNCQPGFFEVRAAEVGDYCVDPACTVPGACGPEQPLGTITRICY